MRKILRYTELWGKLTANSFKLWLTNRFTASMFLFAKTLRFILFIVFLFALFRTTNVLGSYTTTQVLLFFLTFTFVDTLTQLLFREVYRFRPMVVSGDFDLVLVKPMNPLFRALAGGADPLDMIMLVPYIVLLVFVARELGAGFVPTVSYVLMLANGIVIATGFHILVLALAIVTTEIDHAVMIYRDLTSMGRVPIDIYREPLRSILTFAIPVGVMMTFPAKAFLSLLAPVTVVLSLGIGLLFFLLSLGIWRWSLTRYASASS